MHRTNPIYLKKAAQPEPLDRFKLILYWKLQVFILLWHLEKPDFESFVQKWRWPKPYPSAILGVNRWTSVNLTIIYFVLKMSDKAIG